MPESMRWQSRDFRETTVSQAKPDSTPRWHPWYHPQPCDSGPRHSQALVKLHQDWRLEGRNGTGYSFAARN